MPQRNIKGHIQPGDEVWVFPCPSCHRNIPVLNDLDELPDPVELTCPGCGTTHQYQQTEARRAKAHRKQ